METDTYIFQLLKSLPQTFFQLIGQPAEQATAYHFESIEIKKSFRIDGVFVPTRLELPVHFLEAQFRSSSTFCANLFAKVFLCLEANKTFRDWRAAAIFGSRQLEPKHLAPYEDLLRSERVTRIYLDEYPMPADPPLGLGILQLVTVPEPEVSRLVGRMREKVARELAGSELARTVIQLLEELLMRRFTQLDREEIRKMFELHDIRKSRVWQEAHETGIEKGIEKGKALAHQEFVRNCLAKGMSAKEIAELLAVSVREVNRMAKAERK